jgi:hypothetical protein
MSARTKPQERERERELKRFEESSPLGKYNLSVPVSVASHIITS